MLSSNPERILSAINYIEENLATDINLEDIAEEVELSLTHLHRIFQTYLGETAYDYLRRRRLTTAAQQLLDSNDRIVEIASRYQYGSQEAFTRAFKELFGLTPGEYRQQKQRLFSEKPRLTQQIFDQFVYCFTKEPQFFEGQEETVVGLQCHYSAGDDATNYLWKEFLARITRLNHRERPSAFYGLYGYRPHLGVTSQTEVTFMAGVSAKSLPTRPPEMMYKRIPAAQYAVFTNRFPFIPRNETYRYILDTWLPKSGYERAELDILEVFQPGTWSNGEYQILFPIE